MMTTPTSAIPGIVDDVDETEAEIEAGATHALPLVGPFPGTDELASAVPDTLTPEDGADLRYYLTAMCANIEATWRPLPRWPWSEAREHLKIIAYDLATRCLQTDDDARMWHAAHELLSRFTAESANEAIDLAAREHYADAASLLGDILASYATPAASTAGGFPGLRYPHAATPPAGSVPSVAVPAEALTFA